MHIFVTLRPLQRRTPTSAWTAGTRRCSQNALREFVLLLLARLAADRAPPVAPALLTIAQVAASLSHLRQQSDCLGRPVNDRAIALLGLSGTKPTLAGG